MAAIGALDGPRRPAMMKRRELQPRFLPIVAGLFVFFLFAAVFAEAGAGTSRVTHLEGEATWEAPGREPVPLKVGTPLLAGATVATAANARIEITLPDDSQIRLGPSSRLTLEQVSFGSDRKSFSAELSGGRLWARIRSLLTGDKVEVKGPTAVAGVRGTTFQVDAGKDFSTVIKVHHGQVAVRPIYQTHAKGEGPRREVSGPQEVQGPKEVTAQEWARIVASGQMLLVDSESRAGDPTALDLKAEADDPWTAWNQSRDQANP